MKYLYIDESLDENCFVVGGILVDNEQDMLLAYRQFKKSIDGIPMTRKQKERVTHEFKANLLDKSFPQIKRKLLYKLNAFDCKVIYASANKQKITNQNEKENETIYRDLTEWFNKLKTRRQVIVVTHDANIVINSDAENVIIATKNKDGSFDYSYGAMEYGDILNRISCILDGGIEAVERRLKKYGREYN